MKALLLAAGLGTRLRPLTGLIPKPLCLFFGRPVLDIIFEQVKKQGIEAIAINQHHLHELISQHIQSRKAVYSPPPHLSYEAEILGTGGAIIPLRQWLGDDDLLICNGDVIADVDLAALQEQHQDSGADATMVLLDRHKPGTNPVAYTGNRVHAIGDQPVRATDSMSLGTFSGIHIVGPRLVRAIAQSGSTSIIDAYLRLLRAGPSIQAFIHRGFWEDLGTPQDYFDAHMAVLHHPERNALSRRLRLDSSIRWERQSALCGPGPFPKEIQDSFLFGPIQGDALIQSCLVYPDSVLEPGHNFRNLLITPHCTMEID